MAVNGKAGIEEEKSIPTGIWCDKTEKQKNKWKKRGKQSMFIIKTFSPAWLKVLIYIIGKIKCGQIWIPNWMLDLGVWVFILQTVGSLNYL